MFDHIDPLQQLDGHIGLGGSLDADCVAVIANRGKVGEIHARF